MAKVYTGQNLIGYNFRIFALPGANAANTSPGFADIAISTAALKVWSANNCCGCFRNIRKITYDNEEYIACDIYLTTYDMTSIYIIGLHHDISEIKCVTGNFSEID